MPGSVERDIAEIILYRARRSCVNGTEFLCAMHSNVQCNIFSTPLSMQIKHRRYSITQSIMQNNKLIRDKFFTYSYSNSCKEYINSWKSIRTEKCLLHSTSKYYLFQIFHKLPHKHLVYSKYILDSSKLNALNKNISFH